MVLDPQEEHDLVPRALQVELELRVLVGAAACPHRRLPVLDDAAVAVHRLAEALAAVHARLRVLSTECTGCMSCVAACTVPDCLGITRRGPRTLSPWLVPAALMGAETLKWLAAAGHDCRVLGTRPR